jgi:replicative DNA helicase
LVKTIQRIEDMRHRNEDITGVPSGYSSLDRVTYGWQQTDLIFLLQDLRLVKQPLH